MKATRLGIDGVLLLNKPAGWTSNAALQHAKRLYHAAKAGHTGTLDPFASGLLPICFGQATKFSGFALAGNKRYRATLQLGVTTTTADTEGAVVATRPVRTRLAEIEAVLPRFTGRLLQTPPMYSALKHQGKALYEYARQGVTVERTPREVTIFHLVVTAFAEDRLGLEVECSGGTYIRTLAEDIGESLGCGAHLIALERLASGRFSLEQAVTLPALDAMEPAGRAALLLPPDSLLASLPRIDLDADASLRLAQGKHLPRPPLCPDGIVRAYVGPRFFGLLEAGAKLIPHRLMNTENDLRPTNAA